MVEHKSCRHCFAYCDYIYQTLVTYCEPKWFRKNINASAASAFNIGLPKYYLVAVTTSIFTVIL